MTIKRFLISNHNGKPNVFFTYVFTFSVNMRGASSFCCCYSLCVLSDCLIPADSAITYTGLDCGYRCNATYKCPTGSSQPSIKAECGVNAEWKFDRMNCIMPNVTNDKQASSYIILWKRSRKGKITGLNKLILRSFKKFEVIEPSARKYLQTRGSILFIRISRVFLGFPYEIVSLCYHVKSL